MLQSLFGQRKRDTATAISNDDPFCHNDAPTPPPPNAGLVLTGLSEEEDAARIITRSFNPHLFYCQNCEVHYECFTEFDDNCNRCGTPLADKNASPLRRKHT